MNLNERLKEAWRDIPVKDVLFLFPGGKRHINEERIDYDCVKSILESLDTNKRMKICLNVNEYVQETVHDVYTTLSLIDLWFSNKAFPKNSEIEYKGWHKEYLGKKEELHYIELEVTDGKKQHRKICIDYKSNGKR
ncbi:hypothetical protein ACFLZZ_00910 [Nanoarchaeota archaeon]